MLVLVANVIGWPVIHLAAARVALAWQRERFEADDWLTRERGWERRGELYRAELHVRRWKKLLPDGAPWLGGFSKRHVVSRDPSYLAAFIEETRRAEWAHWIMLACTPVFYLWNPPWACAVMTLYGLLANLPCIVAQRANRIQLVRMSARSRACVSALQAVIR